MSFIIEYAGAQKIESTDIILKYMAVANIHARSEYVT